MNLKNYIKEYGQINFSTIWFLLTSPDINDDSEDFELLLNQFEDSSIKNLFNNIKRITLKEPKLSFLNQEDLDNFISIARKLRSINNKSILNIEKIVVLPRREVSLSVVNRGNVNSIFINSSFLIFYTFVCQCIFGYITSGSDEPLSLKKKKEFFLDSFIAIVSTFHFPNLISVPNYVEQLNDFLEYVSVEGISPISVDTSESILIFSLLHEFAHVDFEASTKNEKFRLHENYEPHIKEEIIMDNIAYRWFLNYFKDKSQIGRYISILLLTNSLKKQIENQTSEFKERSFPMEWYRWMELRKTHKIKEEVDELIINFVNIAINKLRL